MALPKHWSIANKNDLSNTAYFPLEAYGKPYCPYMAMGCASAIAGVTLQQGGPFGATIVKNGMPIAVSHNTVVLDKDPTAHAEANAIRIACKVLGTTDLSDCEIYATGEPCPLCWGLCNTAKMSKVYVGSKMKTALQYGFEDALFFVKLSSPAGSQTLNITFGTLANDIEEALSKACVTSESATKADTSLGASNPGNSSQEKKMSDDESAEVVSYMKNALEYGLKHSDFGKNSERIPFGAVVIYNHQIISYGAHTVQSSCDLTATAEINAIREACKVLNNFSLKDCYIVTTAEPNIHSYGAILWSHLDKVVAGISSEKLCKYGFQESTRLFKELSLSYEQRTMKYEFGVMEELCEDVFAIWKSVNGAHF